MGCKVNVTDKKDSIALDLWMPFFELVVPSTSRLYNSLKIFSAFSRKCITYLPPQLADGLILEPCNDVSQVPDGNVKYKV